MIKLVPLKYYHIYNRGNNREKLFYQERNYEYFINRYIHHCFHVLNTYAYCLMNNHFHMLVGVRSDKVQKELFQGADINSKKLQSPSRHLGNFFNSYTLSINKQENRVGSLFQRPFRRKEVNTESYFRQLVIYIHQNPIKHGFTSHIEEYPYSSFHSFLNDDGSFLNKDKVLELFGGIDNFRAAHEEMLQDFEPFQP